MYCNEETLDFIRRNADGDVRRLALRRAEGVDMPFALDQIAGRQTARRKLPSWAAVDGIVYPPHLSMEQCSSEATARYKLSIARRLTSGGRFVDLTGGFGVDFSFLSEAFDEAVYVERQQRLCDIVRSNLDKLGKGRAEVVCADGVDYLSKMSPVELVFIDPARRDANGGRTFGIADCTPDVLQLRDSLLNKSEYTLLKLSPMLDWRKAVSDLGQSVGEVHIVAVGGECKELLLVMSRRYDGLERVFCVDGDSIFSYKPSEETETAIGGGIVGSYLYEPNAAVMKAGCFALLESRFGVRQVSANSHLFTSSVPVDTFPGRAFHIDRVSSLNKGELRQWLPALRQANIAVRNFPLSVAELRRRLKLGDGGNTYIFATTLVDKSHKLLICSKM